MAMADSELIVVSVADTESSWKFCSHAFIDQLCDWIITTGTKNVKGISMKLLTFSFLSLFLSVSLFPHPHPLKSIAGS